MKVLASFLSILLFLTNSLFANSPRSNFWEERRKTDVASLPFSIPAIPLSQPLSSPSIPRSSSGIFAALPAGLGTVRKITPAKNPSGRVILHFQDVHLNPEAQSNISQVLSSLIEKGQVDLVALEGAFAPIDLKDFQSFPHQDTIRAVADAMLQDKKIGGPLHSLMTAGTKSPVAIGIDNRAEYDANVSAFRQSSADLEKIKRTFSEVNDSLSAEKAKTFNLELADFDKQVELYRSGRLSFGSHMKLICSKESPSIDMESFLHAFDMETNLNIPRVEAERSRLIHDLVSKMSKADVSRLTNMSLAYRAGELPHTNFYKALQSLCLKNGVQLKMYTAMNAYLQYVLLSDSINVDKVLTEAAVLEKKSYERLALSQAEKDLIRKSRGTYLAGRLIDFSLTPDEWAEYKNLNAVIPAKAGIQTTANLKASVDWIPSSDGMTNLKSFEQFYVEAESRDLGMAKSLLKEMDRSSARVVVLVTGGFHSSGIAQQMAAFGVSTLSFVPKITKVADESGSAYLSVFNQEKTPLEKLFAGEKLFLSPEAMTPAIKGAASLMVDAAETIGDRHSPRLSAGWARIKSRFNTEVVFTLTEPDVYGVEVHVGFRLGKFTFEVDQSAVNVRYLYERALVWIQSQVDMFQGLQPSFAGAPAFSEPLHQLETFALGLPWGRQKSSSSSFEESEFIKVAKIISLSLGNEDLLQALALSAGTAYPFSSIPSTREHLLELIRGSSDPAKLVAPFFLAEIKLRAQPHDGLDGYLKFLSSSGPSAEAEKTEIEISIVHSLKFSNTSGSRFFNDLDVSKTRKFIHSVIGKRWVAGKTGGPLKIYSRHLGSSFGPEPVSLAILIHEELREYHQILSSKREIDTEFDEWLKLWDIQIDAYDVNLPNLMTIQSAVYPERLVRLAVTAYPDMVDNFERHPDGFKLNAELRNWIHPIHWDLSRAEQLNGLNHKPYDLTFCLNTIEHLKEDVAKRNLIDHLLNGPSQSQERLVVYNGDMDEVVDIIEKPGKGYVQDKDTKKFRQGLIRVLELESDDEDVAISALQALAPFVDSDLTPLLRELEENESSRVKEYAQWLMEKVAKAAKPGNHFGTFNTYKHDYKPFILPTTLSLEPKSFTDAHTEFVNLHHHHPHTFVLKVEKGAVTVLARPDIHPNLIEIASQAKEKLESLLPLLTFPNTIPVYFYLFDGTVKPVEFGQNPFALVDFESDALFMEADGSAIDLTAQLFLTLDKDILTRCLQEEISHVSDQAIHNVFHNEGWGDQPDRGEIIFRASRAIVDHMVAPSPFVTERELRETSQISVLGSIPLIETVVGKFNRPFISHINRGLINSLRHQIPGSIEALSLILSSDGNQIKGNLPGEYEIRNGYLYWKLPQPLVLKRGQADELRIETLIFYGVGFPDNAAQQLYGFNSKTTPFSMKTGSFVQSVPHVNFNGVVANEDQLRLPRGLMTSADARGEFLSLLQGSLIGVSHAAVPFGFVEYLDEILPDGRKLGAYIMGVPGYSSPTMADKTVAIAQMDRIAQGNKASARSKAEYHKRSKTHIEKEIETHGRILSEFHREGFSPLTLIPQQLGNPFDLPVLLEPRNTMDLMHMSQAQAFGYMVLSIRNALRVYGSFKSPQSIYHSFGIDTAEVFLRGYFGFPSDVSHDLDIEKMVLEGRRVPLFKIENSFITQLAQFRQMDFSGHDSVYPSAVIPPAFVEIKPGKPVIERTRPFPLGVMSLFLFPWLYQSALIKAKSIGGKAWLKPIFWVALSGYLEEVWIRRFVQNYLLSDVLHLSPWWSALVYAILFATVLHRSILRAGETTPRRGMFMKHLDKVLHVEGWRFGMLSRSGRFFDASIAASLANSTHGPFYKSPSFMDRIDWIQIFNRLILFGISYYLGHLYLTGFSFGEAAIPSLHAIGILHASLNAAFLFLGVQRWVPKLPLMMMNSSVSPFTLKDISEDQLYSEWKEWLQPLGIARVVTLKSPNNVLKTIFIDNFGKVVRDSSHESFIRIEWDLNGNITSTTAIGFNHHGIEVYLEILKWAKSKGVQKIINQGDEWHRFIYHLMSDQNVILDKQKSFVNFMTGNVDFHLPSVDLSDIHVISSSVRENRKVATQINEILLNMPLVEGLAQIDRSPDAFVSHLETSIRTDSDSSQSARLELLNGLKQSFKWKPSVNQIKWFLRQLMLVHADHIFPSVEKTGGIKIILLDSTQTMHEESVIKKAMTGREKMVYVVAQSSVDAERVKALNMKNVVVLGAEKLGIYYGKAADGSLACDWRRLEWVLIDRFKKESFQAPSVEIVTSKNMTIDFGSNSILFQNEILARALVVILDDNLSAMAMDFETVERLSRLARLIQEQA